MKVLGLSGLAGAGKDYVADILCNEHGFVKVCYADPLKRICMDLFGWSEERLWGESKYRNQPDPQLNGLTARHALQRLGTEFARDCYPDVWVQHLLRTCAVLARGYHGYDRSLGLMPRATNAGIKPVRAVVVPDVRFVNEIKGLDSIGATIVRLIRIGDEPKWDHRSETEQLSVPDEVFNEVIRCASGDLDGLRAAAAALGQRLVGESR